MNSWDEMNFIFEMLYAFKAQKKSEPKEITLDTTKCPVCECYSYGGPRPNPYGGMDSTSAAHHGWMNRFDLKTFICPKCDFELGPDQGRMHNANYYKNRDRHHRLRRALKSPKHKLWFESLQSRNTRIAYSARHHWYYYDAAQKP